MRNSAEYSSVHYSSIVHGRIPLHSRLSAVQYFQHVVGCVRLAEPGKNLLYAMTVRISVTVGHRIHDQHDVVVLVVCAAGRRFHAATERDGRQDLGYATLTQVLM
jgi:hypothetical protein